MEETKEVKEIWKDISGYENIYQISNLGRVKSLTRLVNNTHKSKRLVKERLLKQTICKAGYLKVELSKKQKHETKKIHRLVCAHFLENKENYPVINHKDGNKLNNNVSNLEWCSHRYNSNHYFSKNSKSKYRGVCFNKIRGMWGARCSLNKKRYFLGFYEKEEDAGQTYIDFCKGNKLQY